MREKAKEWFGRYALAVTLGTAAALTAANISQYYFDNVVISAFIASIADALVGYGVLITKDIRERIKMDGKLTWTGFWKVVRNMFIEFGPAEYLDTYVFRPFFFSVFPLFIPHYSLAILLGSLTTEITYFIPVIFSYEMRKKMFKD